MKSEIHPTYHTAVQVSCACGNAFAVGSTAESITVEVCSNCHPFYTGKQKLLDTAGRVDKFRQRQEAAAAQQAKKKTKPKRTSQGKTSQAKVTKLG